MPPKAKAPPAKAKPIEPDTQGAFRPDEVYVQLCPLVFSDQLTKKDIDLAFRRGFIIDRPHDVNHLTLLQYAARIGSASSCEALLNAGADPSIRDTLAAEEGSGSKGKKDKKDKNEDDAYAHLIATRGFVENSGNAAHLAVSNGLHTVISLILKHEKAKDTLTAKNDRGLTPLALACMIGEYKCAEVILVGNPEGILGGESDSKGRSFVYYLVASNPRPWKVQSILKEAVIQGIQLDTSIIDKPGNFSFLNSNSGLIIMLEKLAKNSVLGKSLNVAYEAAVRDGDIDILNLCIQKGPFVPSSATTQDDDQDNTSNSIHPVISRPSELAQIITPGVDLIAVAFLRQIIVAPNVDVACQSLPIALNLFSNPPTGPITVSGLTLLHLAAGASFDDGLTEFMPIQGQLKRPTYVVNPMGSVQDAVSFQPPLVIQLDEPILETEDDVGETEPVIEAPTTTTDNGETILPVDSQKSDDNEASENTPLNNTETNLVESNPAKEPSEEAMTSPALDPAVDAVLPTAPDTPYILLNQILPGTLPKQSTDSQPSFEVIPSRLLRVDPDDEPAVDASKFSVEYAEVRLRRKIQRQIVEFLLTKGFDKSAKDKKGLTPYDHALVFGCSTRTSQILKP